MRRRRFDRPALLLAVVLLVACATPAGAQTSSGAGLPVTLAWRACGGGFQCGSLPVPVNYDDPAAGTVDMAVIRSPARDRSRRLGTLVVNFGGPGDAGTETLRVARPQIPAAVRDRFDIVSFDPRGTGGTRGIDCIDDATTDALATEDPTPDTPVDLQRFYTGANSAVDVNAACIAKFGSWLSAVGTRNVARDLEQLRLALGERRLDFLGFSYGTVLGAVYAQMYPQRIRRMVLDGAVDLSATPQQERLGNIDGFERALGAFLDWCADETSCAFRNGGNPRAVLEQLRDRFESGLTLPTRDGRRAGASTFYLAMLASLYDRKNGWPALAVGLQNAANGNATVLQILADVFLGRGEDGHYNDLQEAIGFITCADVSTPRVSFPEYQSEFDDAVQRAPFLGRMVAGSPIGCDPRVAPAAADAQLGDVRVANAPPTMIIGTTADPATPYAGAVDLQRRIRGSRLLTYQSTEHGAYGRGVKCIDDTVDRYFLRGTLPARNTRCRA